MTDFRGKEITVGSKIVYPGRAGSAMWLNEGTVVGLYPARMTSPSDIKPAEVEIERSNGKRVFVKSLSRVAVVS